MLTSLSAAWAWSGESLSLMRTTSTRTRVDVSVGQFGDEDAGQYGQRHDAEPTDHERVVPVVPPEEQVVAHPLVEEQLLEDDRPAEKRPEGDHKARVERENRVAPHVPQ